MADLFFYRGGHRCWPIDPGYHISDRLPTWAPRREVAERAKRREKAKKENRAKKHSPQFRVALRGRLVTRQIMKRLRREGLIK